MRDVMSSLESALRCCPVCGSSEVRSDEVVDRGWVLLAECARCDRRWTASAEPGAAPHVARARPARRSAREVASAA
jgi:transcription elongation factor Elf1